MSVEAPLPPTLSDMDTSIDSSVSASLSTMDIDNQSVFADDAPADMDLDVVQSSATDNEPLTLLKLPEEVLIKILEHTVVLDKNIVVTQVCKGSNMVSSSAALHQITLLTAASFYMATIKKWLMKLRKLSEMYQRMTDWTSHLS